MSVSYEDGVRQARVFLREESKRLKPEDWILIAEQARQHFARDRPRDLIADITGNGTPTYTLSATVTAWKNKFSRIKKIEYPVGESPPVYLTNDAFMVYRSSNTVEQLKLKSTSPTAAQTLRINYTAPHTFAESSTGGDSGTSTIEDEDKMIFSLLIGHYAALALAADFLKASRSSLGQDTIDFSQKYEDMLGLSDKLLKRYADMLDDSTEESNSYASGYKDLDIKASYGLPYIVNDEDNR